MQLLVFSVMCGQDKPAGKWAQQRTEFLSWFILFWFILMKNYV
jgi:hypothetical protein